MTLQWLGQTSFAAFRPSISPFIPTPLPIHAVYPQAQATRFQTPVTSVADQVYVFVAISRGGRVNTPPPIGYYRFDLPLTDAEIPARGWAKRENFEATINWLKSQKSSYPLLRSAFVSPLISPVGERFILTVRRAQVPEVARRLGLPYSTRSSTYIAGSEGTLGQDESIPGISIECSKCEIWEKEVGSVATGCECAPDPLKIGAAAVVVGGIIWYLMR